MSTESLKVQQPFLVDLTTFGNAMTPATASLNEALPAFVPAIEAGTQTLERTPSLNANLQQVMTALKGLAQAPGTNIALNGLVSTVNTLNPMVRYLGPYQTVCDDWNYWWTYLSEHISEQTAFGFAQRALLNQTNAAQPNNVGYAGRHRSGQRRRAPTRPWAATSTCTRSRTARRSTTRATPTARPASAATRRSSTASTRRDATSPSTRTPPAIRVPTFHGRTRVPAGETFSRNPQTGPQLPANPSNP